ncbi:hypothetical protein ACVGXP_00575, partial [Enterobacter hormaechei]
PPPLFKLTGDHQDQQCSIFFFSLSFLNDTDFRSVSPGTPGEKVSHLSLCRLGGFGGGRKGFIRGIG